MILRFWAAVRALPGLLGNAIPKSVVDGARLDQGWAEEDRQAYVDAADNLEKQLEGALIFSSDAQLTVRHLLSALGDRFPTDVSLLVDETDNANEALAAPATLTNNLFETKEDRPAFMLDGDECYA